MAAGDGSVEINMVGQVKAVGLDQLLTVSKDTTKDVETLATSLESMRVSLAHIIKSQELTLTLVEMQIKRAQRLLATSGDNVEKHEELREILKEVAEAYENLAGMKTDLITPTADERLTRGIRSVKNLEEGLRKAGNEAGSLNTELKELGLDKLATQAKEFFTIGGQIGFWGSMFKEGARQMALWRYENYAVYGSLAEISSQIRTIQKDARVLQKEAEAAAKSLMEMAIDPASLNELGTAIADFHAATGVSTDTAANFAKQLQITGHTSDRTAATLRVSQAVMKRYGVTASDTDRILQVFAKNQQLLISRMGGTPEAANKAMNAMLIVSGSAKKAGMDMAEVATIFETLTTDALKYVVLLGDAINEANPAKQFAIMAANAGDALAMIEELPHYIRESVAKDVYGMTVQQLKQMQKVNEDLEQYARSNKMSLEEAWEKDAEAMAARSDEARRLHDPQFAFNELMQNLQNIFVDIAGPIIRTTAAVASWIGWLMQIAPIRWAIYAIGILIGLFFTLVYVLKLVVLAANVRKVFSGIGDSAKDLTKSLKDGGGVTNALKSIGDGLKGFFKSIASIKLKDVWQAIAAIALIGIVLVGLAWATSGLPPGRLIELGASMVTFAIALYIASQVMKAAGEVGKKAFVGLLIITGALLLVAFAMSLMAQAPMITIGVGLLLVATAMAIFGIVGYYAAPGAILLAIALLIVSVAMLVAAVAFKMFVPAILQLVGVDMIAIGLQMLGFAGLLVLAGFMLVTGTILIGLASVPFLLASALLLAGMWLLGEGLSAVTPHLQGISKFADAMQSLSDGMWMVVDSPYIRFAFGAGFLAAGLYALGPALASVGKLDNFAGFADAMQSISDGMWMVVDSPYIRFAFGAGFLAAGLSMLGVALLFISKVGNLTGFTQSLRALVSLMPHVGSVMKVHAIGIEFAAIRILRAISMMSVGMMFLRAMGLSEVVRTSALVTVRNEIEDKKKESIDRDIQNELLRDMIKNIRELSAAVRASQDTNDKVASTHLAAIDRNLAQWLPEIAEKDQGLGSMTNNWNAGL